MELLSPLEQVSPIELLNPKELLNPLKQVSPIELLNPEELLNPMKLLSPKEPPSPIELLNPAIGGFNPLDVGAPEHPHDLQDTLLSCRLYCPILPADY
ncbi:hypothetical protein MHH60_17210 [Paenibacillus sp. FSL H7-0716]|uniref:Uncharacterized protein n=1 Tax=Paenibacillus odorifer TaxID=189426 RepID=A0AB36J8G7_9BACL|nr:hypothetical protein [Paenibacillus odorifer]OME16056.1 hypothetical protein BSK47_20895 [Paenibacillus odorifer]